MKFIVNAEYLERVQRLAADYRSKNCNRWARGGWVMVSGFKAWGWHANPAPDAVPPGTFAVHESGAVIATATDTDKPTWLLPEVLT